MDWITVLGFLGIIAFFAYVSLVDTYGPGPCNLKHPQPARTCARKA